MSKGQNHMNLWPLAKPGSDRIGSDRTGPDRIGSDRIGSDRLDKTRTGSIPKFLPIDRKKSSYSR